MFPEVEFPEEAFPPPAHRWSEYRRLLKIGIGRMRESSVVLCGLARDVGSILPKTIARMERLGEMFRDYRVVLFENDSRDDTAEVLTAWASHNSRVKFVSETIGDPINPVARCLNRATRMAYYRNRCLEVMRAEFADFIHAIVLDTDLKGGWSTDGIANTFGHDGWDFVGSNGIIFKRMGVDLNVPIQYDAWAFRLDDQLTALPTGAVNAMQWQRGQPLVPVSSCFGGLGVYRMPALLSANYDGWDSEHIPLHQHMRRNGFDKLFLNPSQITVYGRRRRSMDRWMLPFTRWLLALKRQPRSHALLSPSLVGQPLCLDLPS